MIISDLTVHVHTHTPRDAPWNARTRWSTKTVLLVRVQTSDGIFGVGEAWVDGADARAVAAVLEHEVRPLVMGCDPFLTESIFHTLIETTIVSGKRGIMHAAASAIDIALWDIKGKAAGLPVYKMLGGNDDAVYAYASGGLYKHGKTPQDLAAELAGYVAQGFSAVKIKIAGVSLREDLARIAAVREAVGPDVKLMVDALYAYTLPEAKKMARLMEPFDIEFFEAPISSYDVDGLADLARASPIPLAGNEIEIGRHAFNRLIERRAVSVVHVEAILCGGISEAFKIAALAAAHNLPVSMHNSSSVVAFAANLHIGAAIANCHSVEYHMIHRLLFDRVPDDLFRVEDSRVRVPDKPGLGLDFDPAA